MMANGLEMMLSTEVELLQSENARLREELAAAQDDAAAWKYEADGFRKNRDCLSEELAAAQAMIEQMREKSEAAKNACMVASSGCSHIKTHAECNEARQFAHATKINVETILSALNEALALTPNLDALHEARALECERLAGDGHLSIEGTEWLLEEAADHRARKEEK